MEFEFSKLLIFILFIILSAFFSSTETAFTAINRIRLKKWFEKENSDNVDRIESLLSNPSRLITAILIGNNFANVACTAIGTTILIEILHQLNIINPAFVMPIITIVLTILLLIFGEITPKTLALKQPEAYAVFSAKFLSILVFILLCI